MGKVAPKNVAVAGGIVGALPALILVVALPNLGSLLFLVLMVGAAAFVWAGRAQFR